MGSGKESVSGIEAEECTMTFTTIYIHTYSTSDGHKPSLRERLEMRKTCGPYRFTPTVPGQARGFYQAANGLHVGDGTFNLRLEKANEHLTGRLSRIDGYYCDSEAMGDTLQPIVARLNHGYGFLAGWTMGNGMCGSIEMDVWATAEEAARRAHDLAEYDAEEAQRQELVEQE